MCLIMTSLFILLMYQINVRKVNYIFILRFNIVNILFGTVTRRQKNAISHNLVYNNFIKCTKRSSNKEYMKRNNFPKNVSEAHCSESISPIGKGSRFHNSVKLMLCSWKFFVNRDICSMYIFNINM